jgi:hypothetical protein
VRVSTISLGNSGRRLAEGTRASWRRPWAARDFELVEREGLFDGEGPGDEAPELGEVGTAAEAEARIVGEGADVGTGGAGDADGGLGAFETEDVEGVYGDGDGRQVDLDIAADEFVGFAAADFLGGDGGRGLIEGAEEGGKCVSELVEGESGGGIRGGGFPVGIVGIGGKAETDDAFVDFVVPGEELGEAGGAVEQEREDPCSEGIKGAEVADFAGIGDAAHLADDVVGSPAAGLVDDDDTIHGRQRKILLSNGKLFILAPGAGGRQQEGTLHW